MFNKSYSHDKRQQSNSIANSSHFQQADMAYQMPPTQLFSFAKNQGQQASLEPPIQRQEARATDNEPNTDISRHLESDWAGRAILARYLAGLGDWNIVNDSNWNDYMMADARLKAQLQNQIDLLSVDLAGTPGTHQVDHTFHANMANGEGIVGYQYLHGSNGNVGDFKIHGTANVEHTEEQAIITFNLNFTWNDAIDPNPQYTTDSMKSLFAEAITHGRADAYNIHIQWTSNNIQVTNPLNSSRPQGSGAYPYN